MKNNNRWQQLSITIGAVVTIVDNEVMSSMTWDIKFDYSKLNKKNYLVFPYHNVLLVRKFSVFIGWNFPRSK